MTDVLLIAAVSLIVLVVGLETRREALNAQAPPKPVDSGITDELERLLKALRAEYAAGNLDPDEYETEVQRALENAQKARREAARKRIDAIKNPRPPGPPPKPRDAAYSARPRSRHAYDYHHPTEHQKLQRIARALRESEQAFQRPGDPDEPF